MAKSVEIRDNLVEALRLDLVGPDNNHAFANELLPAPPSRWYLTGFLVPTDAPLDQRVDDTSDEEIDSADDAGALDDSAPPDRAAARRGVLPSSMGLSVLVPSAVRSLEATVSWGDYIWEAGDKTSEPDDHPTADQAKDTTDSGTNAASQSGKAPSGYRRTPHTEKFKIDLPAPGQKRQQYSVPNSKGLVLSIVSRAVSATSERIPAGTISLSVFLVNGRKPDENHRYRAFAFQAGLQLRSETPFVPRPDLRGQIHSELGDEWDERVADLHYRDVFEYAVGHGLSGIAVREPSGECLTVRTTWLPTAEVQRVAPSAIQNVELKMETLGTLVDGASATLALAPLVQQYESWITAQEGKLQTLSARRVETSRDLIALARYAARRIQAGIEALTDPQVLEAFKIANRAIAQAIRRRMAIDRRVDPASLPPPEWYTFQLAFILMTLTGIKDPAHSDRETVDLLFFPTGGGKTEAYLGLAAFTMVLRRLTNPGIHSAGLTVLMRYTLRLLTLDQLGRAAALICALEMEREHDSRLGAWPFEIGLWVGTAATPNRMGHQGYNGPGKEDTAYTKFTRFRNNSRSNPAPIPIENCPWCGTKFEPESFRLVPNQRRPINLVVHCVNHRCEFSGDRPLPIVGVDEAIYQRLPAFVIATVDKFASLPWVAHAGALFGNVDRYDQNGFYGPAGQNGGTPIGGRLLPPELIIQDELHLISGPLGTIAGIYETAVDFLSSREVNGHIVRPKIVASTATVRRASSQINALFERTAVSVFPPQGVDRTDSFFAHTEPSSETPARKYVGVAAQGRSLKVVFLRASLALLAAGQTAYQSEGGKKNSQNPADPYMTLLGYFNSLRELGGSRRIVEDEVRTRLAQYSTRKRKYPQDDLFANRNINYEVTELTSRVPTNDVAEAKRKLAMPFHSDDRIDVALATNMISVGLDIIRLGLMVVLGQPKSRAEYIQATSRVGRDPARPGLVVTLLNVHKPRDRSHYERFENFHATFYRTVEPTGVTPFSPRALDRALVAGLVALVRHGRNEMVPPLGAGEILRLRSQLDAFATRFAQRAENHSTLLTAEDKNRLRETVINRCRSLLDDWFTIAQQFSQTNTRLQYQRWEASGAQRLLYDILDPELQTLNAVRRRFRANRSMRDVERSVDIAVKNLDDWPDRP